MTKVHGGPPVMGQVAAAIRGVHAPFQ